MKVSCPMCNSTQINEVDRPQIDAPNKFYVPCNCQMCGADFDVILAVSQIRMLIDLEISEPGKIMCDMENAIAEAEWRMMEDR